MRLANGIVIDKEATFGALKFSALRREVHLQNEDGSVSEEIKERTYDLKSRGQGRMIQVSIPASVPLKEFDYNAEVELINPVADTVATATLPDSIRLKCSRLIPAMTASFVWDTPYCKRLSAKSCIHSVSFSAIPPLRKNCDILYPMSQQ